MDLAVVDGDRWVVRLDVPFGEAGAQAWIGWKVYLAPGVFLEAEQAYEDEGRPVLTGALGPWARTLLRRRGIEGA